MYPIKYGLIVMHMQVCVCVCVCVYVCVCVHMCASVGACVHAYACNDAGICVHKHTCVCMSVHACASVYVCWHFRFYILPETCGQCMLHSTWLECFSSNITYNVASFWDCRKNPRACAMHCKYVVSCSSQLTDRQCPCIMSSSHDSQEPKQGDTPTRWHTHMCTRDN